MAMTREDRLMIQADMLENIMFNDWIRDVEDPLAVVKECIKVVEKKGIGMEGKNIVDLTALEDAIWEEIEKRLGD